MRQIYTSLVPYEQRHWFYKLRHLKDYQDLRTTVYPSSKGDFSLKPFDENRCIFIHITKTAGTSVAKSLFGYLPYHYTAVDYRVIYGRNTFNHYFKFAFVRNPWDRLYSAFRYLKAGGWDEEDRQWAERHLGDFDSFDSFVKKWLNTDNINLHRHFWPQYRFICDRKKRILVDYLAYFETLEDDFSAICTELHIDTSLEQHNVNPGKSYPAVYDDETQNIVGRVYAADIELFGYRFDGIERRTKITATK